MIAPADVVAELLALFREEMRAAVREAMGEGRGENYSSHDLPPRVTRRRFRELCARGAIAGARKEGAIWVCPRQAWHEARRRTPRSPTNPAPVEGTPLAARADALLSRAGLRVVRGPR